MVNLKRILCCLPLLAQGVTQHNFSSIPMAGDGNGIQNSEFWGLSDLNEVGEDANLFIPPGSENLPKLQLWRNRSH